MQRDWDKIQQEQYVPWMNRYLVTRNLKVNNFHQDLSNGILIINLLEIITGDSVGRFNKNPRFAIQKRDNFDLVFTFMKKHGTHVIGCSTQDIVRGETKVLLSLVWNIIRMAEKIKGKSYKKEKTVLFPQKKNITKQRTTLRSNLFNKWEQRVEKQKESATKSRTKRETRKTQNNYRSNIVIHRTKRFAVNKPKTSINNKPIQKNNPKTNGQTQTSTKPNTKTESKPNIRDNKSQGIGKQSKIQHPEKKIQENSLNSENNKAKEPTGLPKPEKEPKIISEKIPKSEKIENKTKTISVNLQDKKKPEIKQKTEQLPKKETKKKTEQLPKTEKNSNKTDKGPQNLQDKTKETAKKTQEFTKKPDKLIKPKTKSKTKPTTEPRKEPKKEPKKEHKKEPKKEHKKKTEQLPKSKKIKKKTEQLPKTEKKLNKTDKGPEISQDKTKETAKKTQESTKKPDKLIKPKTESKTKPKTEPKTEPRKEPKQETIKTNEPEQLPKSKKIKKKTEKSPKTEKKLNKTDKGTEISQDKINPIETETKPVNVKKETQEANKPEINPEKEPIESQEEKRKNRRKKIAEEIYSSEETYVTSLKTMIGIYLNPMKNHLKQKQIRYIFSEIDSIINFNELLLEEIKPRCTNWNEKTFIGDIFLKLISDLKIYTDYINNYNTAIQTLSRLTSKKKDLAKLLDNQSRLPIAKGLKLTFFLIMPIQRIPRYVMLLQDMVKHTNKNHPDYDNLKQSLNKVQEIAIYCNEKKREADQMAETFKIESKISGLSNIVNPSRRFLRGGVTYIKPKNGKKIIECYLHLFNDLLIISKKAKKLKLLNIIELDLETYILNSHPYIIEDNSQNNNININIIQNKGNNSNNNSDNSDNNGSNGNTATTVTNSNNSNNKNDDDKDDNNDQNKPTQLFGFTIRSWTFFKKDNDFTFGTTFYFDSKIEKLEWITAFDRLKNNRMEDFKTRTTKEINNPELLAKNTEIDFLKEKQWSMEKIHQKSKKGGYLMKHSHTKIQNIKHSFLVLLRDNLLIFKYNMEEEETYISDLSKTIFLGTCSVVFNPNYQNGLQILTPDRIYYFSSKKLENTLKWICVLRKQTYQLLNAKLKEEKKLRGIEEINTDEKTSSKEFDKLTINVHNLKNRVSDSPKTRSKRMSLRILSSPISPLREKKKNLFENIKFGDQVFKKGYIHKHSSNIFKEWKQRYAVLKANHLLFFNNEKEQDYLTEVIDLAFCKFEIRVNNKFILEKKFAFDLVTSDRIYILKCKTRNGLFEWMEAIQNRIKSIEDLTHRNVQQELINISNSGENVKNGEKGENKVEEREERMKERKGRKERKKGKEDRRKKRRGRKEEREERRKDERGGKRREERQDRRKERRERREKKGNKKLLEKKVKEEQD